MKRNHPQRMLAKKSTIEMSTIAARHHTKSSSKKSCKDKSITGMESNSKRGPDGEETVWCREKQSPTQKACPTWTKTKSSLVTAKKKDHKEWNKSNDEVHEMLCLMCGTISDKNAQLTLKCSLKRKITRYELCFLCYWFISLFSITDQLQTFFVYAKRETVDNRNKECKKVTDMMTVFSSLY